MMVDEKNAKFKTVIGGKAYYFCSESCKKQFEKNPNKFVK